MSGKENQRVALTRQLLQGAFVELLQTTPLHSLSIRALCERAGINRTTFYNHYGSQYDLLADMSRRFTQDVAQRLGSAEGDGPESVHQRVGLVLTYLAENRPLARLLLSNNLDPTFAQRLFSLPRIEDLLTEALGSCPDERHRRAATSFVIHGCYRLLQEWLLDEEPLPPQAQAEMMLGLARRVCRQGGI